MTNPSDELVRRWQDIRARMEAVPEDTPYIDVFADAVEWAADAILAATGEAVAWQQRDKKHDGTWSNWYPTSRESWVEWSATPHDLFEVRPLYASPREGHVEVPVEPGVREAFTALDLADSLIERAYGLDVPREWNMAYRKVAKARALQSKKPE